MQPVTMYTTPYCGFCHAAKRLLQEKGVSFTEIDVAATPELRGEMMSRANGGYTVPPHYDSMIGKLIVHRPTREEAIATMRRALAEIQTEGISTTASFHEKVLQHPEFVSGKHDTKFVEREFTGK